MNNCVSVTRVGGELITSDDADLPVLMRSGSDKSYRGPHHEITFDLLPCKMKLIGAFPHIVACRLYRVGLIVFVVGRRPFDLRIADVLVFFENAELLCRYNLTYKYQQNDNSHGG